MAESGGKALLDVAVVAPERQVWRGQASMVTARTTEGEMGVLPAHESTFSVLIPCLVQVHTSEAGPLTVEGRDGPVLRVVIDGGFISVHDNHVSILAERVWLAEDIYTEQQREALDRAESANDHDAAHLARACLALAEDGSAAH